MSDHALTNFDAGFMRAAMLYTHPHPQPSALPDDVVKDAHRYRWLRNGDYPFSFAQRVLNDTPWGIDAAIDAAMLKEVK